MNSHEFEIQINTAKYDSLVEHLTSCSSSFDPPLDTYVDIGIYAKKIFTFAVTFEAIHKDKLIGLAAVYYNDQDSKTGYLTNLSLLKDYHGKGIASKLMHEAIKCGKENGFINLDLKVKISNDHAVAFYEKLGFIQTGISQDCYAMSYKLNSGSNG